MRRPSVLGARAIATVAVALAVPGATSAQTPVLLRFLPPVGQVLRTVTEVRTTTTLVGFPAVPDSAAYEEETWTSATQRVVGEQQGGLAIEVTLDSVRGRERLAGEPWTDRADSAGARPTARAVLSEQFYIVDQRGHPQAIAVLGAFVLGGGFAFPAVAVTPGTSFPTDGRIRTRVRTDPAWGLAVDEVVSGPVSFTLDSVVGDGAETLAYLHFQESFESRTIAPASEFGDRTASYRGGFAGRLVWSPRWGGFVSAAVRLRVDGRIRAEGPRGVTEAQAIWDRTVLHRLRP
jgi:hypothetical protein